MQLFGVTTDRTTVQEFRRNLRKLERRLFGQLDGEAVCCGVTRAQCHVLLAIDEKGMTTATDLAADLELDKSTLSRTIDGLVAAGLVRRETNEDNRRSRHISLTGKGQEVASGIDGEWNRYFESLFAGLSQDARRKVVEGISILSDLVSSGACCEGLVQPAEAMVKKGETKGSGDR